MVPLIFLGFEDVIDSGWQGQYHVILIYCLLFFEADFGEGQGEEEHFLPARDAGYVPEFIVDHEVQVLLEGLVLEQFFRGVLFRAEIDDLDGPDG